MLVDACRNDPLNPSWAARPIADLVSVTRPFKKRPPGGVAAPFSCCRARSPTRTTISSTVFFHFVIKGLKGDADEESGNDDGKVTLGELASYTTPRCLEYVDRDRAMTSSCLSTCSRPTQSTWLIWAASEAIRHQLDRHEVCPDQGWRVPDGISRLGQGRPGRREAPAPSANHPAVLPERARGHPRPVPPVRGRLGIPDRRREGWHGGLWWNEATSKFEQAPQYTWRETGFEQMIFTPSST